MNNYGIIIVEDLSIKGMLEKRKKIEALNKHILRRIYKNAILQGGRSWWDFYKETLHDASKKCAMCGSKIDMELSDRIFKC